MSKEWANISYANDPIIATYSDDDNGNDEESGAATSSPPLGMVWSSYAKRITPAEFNVPKPVIIALQASDQLVSHARNLEAKYGSRHGMRYVIEFFDQLLRAARFATCSAILEDLEPDSESVSFLVAVLSVTFPARRRIHARGHFFRRVRISLERRGLLEDGLLNGLE